MKIRRLAVGEFGIFRDQIMEDIAGGIVLLAGPNRAGKTTFMHIIRYLGYPFPRTGVIPPPVHEYRIEADILSQDGAQYRIHKAGYAQPEMVPVMEAPPRSAQDIFPMDQFTYQQLFTISLDELRRLPAGMHSKESKRLQSILLGAGLAEIAVIPEIRDRFGKEATKIGGKHGTPSVTQFKSDYEIIDKALQLRREALHQIDEYEQTQQVLRETEQRLRDLDAELQQEQLRRDRLDFLYQYYDSYHQLREAAALLNAPENQSLLEQFPAQKLTTAHRLHEDYPTVLEEHDNLLEQFKVLVNGASWQETFRQLLAVKSELRQWERNLSGLRQRIDSVRDEEQNHQRKEQSLFNRMRTINARGGRDFEILESIRTDHIEIGRLRQTATAHKDRMQRIESLQDQKQRLNLEQKRTSDEYEDLSQRTRGRRYWYISAITGLLLAAGIVTGIYYEPWIGIIIGSGGALFTILFGVIAFILKAEDRRIRRQLEEDIGRLSLELKDLDDQIGEYTAELKDMKDTLNGYRRMLRLEEDLDPEILVEYYRDTASLKQEVREWQAADRQLRQRRSNILAELEDIISILDAVQGIGVSGENLMEESEKILHTLESAIEWLETAESLREKQNEKDRLEEQIRELLLDTQGQLELGQTLNRPGDFLHGLQEFISRGERFRELQETQRERAARQQTLRTAFSDRVKTAFQAPDENDHDSPEDLLPVLEKAYDPIISRDEVKVHLEESSERVTELQSELRNTRERQARLKQSLEELATSEKLHRAQEEIDQARSRLEPLAREYAINRLAAYFLDRVRDRFLNRTRDELLDKASEIFKQLTSSDYIRIYPPDELDRPDFLVQTDGESQIASTEYLSRGTQEQLFLAVRLSRIFEMPSLPVILDDSLVNFDVQHRRQAAAIVNELADHNQIFVLTCHPEIVEYLAEQESEIQYWTVDDGHIERAEEYAQVLQHLTRS
ncbi:MAG TPA: AAA family ATPase [bacterium]|nr:AAA family ATPase [bacterium]